MANGPDHPKIIPKDGCPVDRVRIPKPKGGRPILCATDSNGVPVLSDKPQAYLCWDSGPRRFYVLSGGKKTYLPTADPTEAVARFRDWCNRNRAASPKVRVVDQGEIRLAGKPVKMEPAEWLPDGRTIFGLIGPQANQIDQLDIVRPERSAIIEDDLFWIAAHDQFFELGAKEFSRRIGVPEIARVGSLPKPQPSLKLSEALCVIERRLNCGYVVILEVLRLAGVIEEARRKLRRAHQYEPRIVGYGHYLSCCLTSHVCTLV